MSDQFLAQVTSSPYLNKTLKDQCRASFEEGTLTADLQERILTTLSKATPTLDKLRGEALTEVLEESTRAYFASQGRAAHRRKASETTHSLADTSAADHLLSAL